MPVGVPPLRVAAAAGVGVGAPPAPWVRQLTRHACGRRGGGRAAGRGALIRVGCPNSNSAMQRHGLRAACMRQAAVSYGALQSLCVCRSRSCVRSTGLLTDVLRAQ